MTPWATPDVFELDSWEDLEEHLSSSSRPITIIVGRDGPVVTMDVSGFRTGGLRVTDPRDRLRSQDRRRLHRLGLRPQLGTAERCWTWETSAQPATGGSGGELVRARMQAWTYIEEACCTQTVAVLREALRLEPSQLTVLPVDEEPEDDDAWDDEWGDVG